MDFKEATDRLIELDVPLRDLAGELGVSHALLIAARLDPENPNSRRPPDGWREAVKRIAERRKGELGALAEELERE